LRKELDLRNLIKKRRKEAIRYGLGRNEGRKQSKAESREMKKGEGIELKKNRNNDPRAKKKNKDYKWRKGKR